MLLQCVSSYHCCLSMSVHSRPTWYIEESRKSYCNKGSGQKRLPDLPCQVNWRRGVNFFVQSLPYCIFFDNTTQLHKTTTTDSGRGDMKKTQNSQSMAMRVQDIKKSPSVGSWNINLHVHLTNALDQNARTANVVRPTEHKHFDQDGLIWPRRKPSFSASSFNSCTVS